MNNTFFFSNIKAFLIIIGFCFIFYSMQAQSSNTEYFMSSSFSNTTTNPAKRPEKGYVGIPALTNYDVDFKTNTLNLDHLIFPGVGENGKSALFLHENVSYDDFMKNISTKNYLGANVDWTLLGFGLYVKDLFLSFDISERSNVTLNIPKDLFDFTKRGFAMGEDGTTYNMSNLKATTKAFTQIGFGGSYPLLNQSLVVGAKVKILLGNAYANFQLDNMRIDINNDLWKVSTQASGNMLIPTVQPRYDDTGKLSELNTDGSFSPFNGWGLGLDLGATFKPDNLPTGTLDWLKPDWLKPVTFSVALTDIGFISWNKSKMTSLATNPSEIIVTGNRTIHVDGSNEDLYKDLQDALNDAIALYPSDNGSISSGLGAKLNWGVEYALMDNRMNLGFLNTNYFNPVKTISELTLGGSYRLTGAVEVGLSYSFVHSKFQTFGFALHLGPGFYIASDYAIPHVNSSFIPTSTKALNFQFGCVIPIGKKPKPNTRIPDTQVEE